MYLNNNFYALVLLIFSTCISLFAGVDNRNFLLIGFIVLFIPIYTLVKFKSISKEDNIAYLLFLYMFFVNSFVPNQIKWTSFLYSCLFLQTFILYNMQLRKSLFTVEDYEKIIKIIILSYFIVLIAQQICSITGLPIINKILSVEEDFKFNSLAIEPSHAARILTLLMYSLIYIYKLKNPSCTFKDIYKEKKIIILCYTYSCITMGSTTGLIFMSLLSLLFINRKNYIIFFVVILSIFIVLNSYEISGIQRAVNFIKALTSFDRDEMLDVDHSGALRVLPTFIYFDYFSLYDLKYWIGSGTGNISNFLYGLIPGVEEEDIGAGFIPAFLLDYGIVGQLIFILFIIKYCFTFNAKLGVILWITMLSSVAFNSQVFWLSLMLYSTNKYFYVNSNPKKYYRKISHHN